MGQVDIDEMIMALEEFNRERIINNNDTTILKNKRRNRLINEIKHFQIKKLFSHILVRTRPQISTTQSESNFSIEKEVSFAKTGNPHLNIAIYTCITGNYDKPAPPYVHFSNCSYFMISDSVKSNGWDSIEIETDLINRYGLSLANRYVKFHPDEFFGDKYDYAIYLDGNLTPVSDLSALIDLVDEEIGLAFHKHCSRNKLSEESVACLNQNKGNAKKIKKQMELFKKEGFPDDYGLVEGNFYICDLRNHNAVSMLHQCWEVLLSSDCGRDQIIWPYIFWKNGYSFEKIATLGSNVWRNVKILVNDHNDSKNCYE